MIDFLELTIYGTYIQNYAPLSLLVISVAKGQLEKTTYVLYMYTYQPCVSNYLKLISMKYNNW